MHTADPFVRETNCWHTIECPYSNQNLKVEESVYWTKAKAEKKLIRIVRKVMK